MVYCGEAVVTRVTENRRRFNYYYYFFNRRVVVLVYIANAHALDVKPRGLH